MVHSYPDNIVAHYEFEISVVIPNFFFRILRFRIKVI